MKTVLKVLFIVFIGLPAAAMACLYIVAVYSYDKSKSIDINPSSGLITLASYYELPIPPFEQPDCEGPQYRGSKWLSMEVESIGFNSMADKAKSAEAAAFRYHQQGNKQMAAMATEDAISRSQSAWRMKADMNCHEILSQRRSY